MSEPSIFFSEVNERQGVFHRRVFLLGGVAGLGLVALGGRLAALQLVETNSYQRLSEKNQFNFPLIPPPRGLIVDRYGVVLATNRSNFTLQVHRQKVSDFKEITDKAERRRRQAEATAAQIDDIVAKVGTLVPLDAAKLARLRAQLAAAPVGAPVAAMEDMTWEEFARVQVRTPELPQLSAELNDIRAYPYQGAFAHVVGYVSQVTPEDVQKEVADGGGDRALFLHPGFRIGKTGVEKAFDQDLRGEAGYRKVEVDVKGRVVRDDSGGGQAPVPGKKIELTLDADIQNRAIEVFGGESGAAVMMDCRTGDILCLVSAPTFDANRFVKGLSGPELLALSTYDHKPMFNKALSANYPPGSTFKTMVALAALEKGVDRNHTYVCGGAWAWGGRVWHCDKAHGAMDMHNAIKTSCDIFFYQTALATGPDNIAKVARMFGLGDLFDIGIPGQHKGIVPDTAWKKSYPLFKNNPAQQIWYPGDTPSMGIGQGYTVLNPLQLCVMVARLANGKKAINPRLVKSVGGVEQPPGDAASDLAVNPEHLAFVQQAMASVANDAGGTGYAASQLGLGPIKMAGKTGTAQSHGYGSGPRSTLGGAWAQRDHAWFVAFAPYDDPRYACAILVEHGGWGASAAAPRARELMRIALLKDPEVRARITDTSTPTPDLPSDQPLDGAAPPPPTADPAQPGLVPDPTPVQAYSEGEDVQ